MDANNTSKLSRRDALKLLGAAAGASVLANLPSEWSTPQLTAGVLPAHAQTSVPEPPPQQYTLVCEDPLVLGGPNGSFEVFFTGRVIPDHSGIPLSYSLELVNFSLLASPPNPSVPSPVFTEIGGEAHLTVKLNATGGPGLVRVTWGFANPSDGSGTCSEEWIPDLPTVQTLLATSNPFQLNATLNGLVLTEGAAPVTQRGFYYGLDNDPDPTNTVVVAAGGGQGAFSVPIATPNPGNAYFYRAWATSAFGTSVGGVIPFTTGVCLVEGTLITLADRSLKKIEDIQYSDSLCVWNFDEGHFDSARPLWIKQAEVTDRYNLLEFSDGSTLKTINQHRIFNKQKGMFTYPMTGDTPIGTTTFNIHGEEVTLVKKGVVHERVNYYNVITEGHINMFAEGLLTSCRYNNIYPIVDMKFVKDERLPIPREQYGVDDKYYDGLRLAEQTIPVADTRAYVGRLESLKLGPAAEVPEAVVFELEAVVAT
jgi:hypothetical protein